MTIKKKVYKTAADFIAAQQQWKEEISALRRIALSCGLDEEIKWNKPCYTYKGKNVVIIQPFKNFCALMFFKGYLLDDPQDILAKTGPNTTKGRQLRFRKYSHISTGEQLIRSYILQAIQIEK